jgi:hypothetical protein
MPGFNIDAGTVLGVIALLATKYLVLPRYKLPTEEWRRWGIATIAGVAVSITYRVIFH